MEIAEPKVEVCYELGITAPIIEVEDLSHYLYLLEVNAGELSFEDIFIAEGPTTTGTTQPTLVLTELLSTDSSLDSVLGSSQAAAIPEIVECYGSDLATVSEMLKQIAASGLTLEATC